MMARKPKAVRCKALKQKELNIFAHSLYKLDKMVSH